MKRVFLESHHLKNFFFGFGQFNLHLIKAMLRNHPENMQMVLHAGNKEPLRELLGTGFQLKKYFSFRRYKPFRIREKYDLWHSLNQNTRIEPYHSIPYLLTVHNITYITDRENYMEEPAHQRFQEKIDRSHAITYISKYAKESTHQFFDVPEVPEYVIYNGNPVMDIDLQEDFQPTHPVQAPFLFSIGEFTPRKNFKALVRMLTQLPEFQLVIAGKNTTGYAQELRQLIAKEKLGDRVLLPGKISEMEKKFYYKNCTAFVFPSLREGFGLPVIEAMRFGKPVFISNNTSLPEIGGKLAFFWDHYDRQYMAQVLQQGLKQYSENPEHYQKELVKRAKSFSWDQAANQYLEVYKSLLF